MQLPPAATTGAAWVISAVLGLFGGGSLISLLRVKQDKQQIIVQAAQGALIVQSGVLDSLHKEMQDLQAELREVRAENANLHNENVALRRRVAALEDQVTS